MLRIKDEIDLKELEKFGFWEVGISYKRPFLFGGEIYVDKETKKITRLHPYSLKENPEEEIQDLIQAGYVEKVGD